MSTPSAYEQLMLELINQSRIDPDGEFDRLILDVGSRTGVTAEITNAIRFFNVNLNVLKSQFDALSAAAPLAWSNQLSVSATAHSQLMIDFDQQSHDLPGEPGLLQRVQATGYQVQSIGENIFLNGQDALFSHAAFFIDWGNTPTGILSPPGHRLNIMNSGFTEIGIGAIFENNPATQAGPYSITQHIGNSFSYAPQLLGVVINDTDNDDFYDIGEGVSGVTVTASGPSGTFTTTTWGSGGYQLVLPAGAYSVTFDGPNVNYSANVTIAGANVKLDAEAAAAPQEPDLTASNVTISDTTPDPGQMVNVGYVANNIGSGAASAFRAGVYLSTNTTITTFDTLLGDQSFTSLAGSSSVNGNVSVSLPGWVVPGTTYYVGVIADDLDTVTNEQSESNNASYVAVTIPTASPGQPDLTASNVTISDTTPEGGQLVTVGYTVSNIGSEAVGEYDVGVYFSTDSTITTDDLLIGWESFASLAGGSSVNREPPVTIPSGVVPGTTYYVGVIADDLNEVTNEASESNNTSYVAVTAQESEPDILGTPGNDTYFASSGRSFTGNGGHDIVVFSGNSSEYSITRHVDDSFTIADGVGGRDGSDILSAIEALQFSDKTIFIQDTDGANIARLYSAGLGRPPDPVGLFGWNDIYASNIPASVKAQGVYVALALTNNGYGTSIAGGFTQSIEFQQRYGTLNDTGFVTQLYFNVLERAPELAGLTGWLDLMGNGGFTREMVLVGFAQSPENVAKTASDWLIEI